MLQVGSRMTATMETSFYADDAISPFLSASRRGGGDMTSANHERIRSLKKSMTLDLAAGSTTASSTTSSATMKRPIFGLLSSPDLNLLKLASPELEKLIIAQNNGQVTTTPTPGGGGGGAGSHQFIFAKTVTEEQEMYARGFVDALAELHHGGTSSSMDDEEDDDVNDSMEASSGSESGGSAISGAPTAFSTFGGNGDHAPFQLPSGPPAVLSIKEEPQIVPSESPPPSTSSSSATAAVGHPIGMSPIDMLAQERIKLERKRQRNRVAASKCRKRKLERIARLEDKVKLLKDENGELGTVVTKLKDHICGLKQQLMDHVNSGCQIMTPSQYLS